MCGGLDGPSSGSRDYARSYLPVCNVCHKLFSRCRCLSTPKARAATRKKKLNKRIK